MRKDAERHGFGGAAKEAHFIAAPLLTAAALGLAGVVAGADDEFRWPGVTLLLLVATSMTLIASIQLAYYALQFKFTWDEREERRKALRWAEPTDAEKKVILRESQIAYEDNLRYAGVVFNCGTLMLGFGIAAALVPPDCGEQFVWRMTSAVLVLLCTIADGVWVWILLTDWR
ncbi:hypothetical protein [Streptomyces sp. AS02]|uniref:hypothetical protein n=1 Tax=Streptomyces sp. AS02 TaxID=2938946 RepID=UPI00201FC086|nr:hypothetical protein [Streptomyces sp. AS02]MCL8011773.1 hypothetical protein [Streptomyces sp. AS02]